MKTIQNYLLAIALLTCTAAQAQEVTGDNQHSLGLYAVGGTVGYVKPGLTGGTFSLAVRADLGDLTTNLALFPSISYWKKGYDVQYSEYSSSSYSASYQEIGLATDVHYYFNPKANTTFYAGGGAGIYFGTASAGSASVSGSEFGINVLGGVETPISGAAQLVAEFRYKIADVNTFGLNVGATFPIGN